MEKLTNKEEEILQILWKLEKALKAPNKTKSPKKNIP